MRDAIVVVSDELKHDADAAREFQRAVYGFLKTENSICLFKDSFYCGSLSLPGLLQHVQNDHGYRST